MPAHLKSPKIPGESRSARLRRLRKENPITPEQNRAAGAKWRAANPEQSRAINRKARLRHKYGLSPLEQRQMFENQEGLCGVCSQPMCMCVRSPRCETRACVDHDHETGKPRGLLHYKCNLGLGYLKDSPILLRNAASYLETTPNGAAY